MAESNEHRRYVDLLKKSVIKTIPSVVESLIRVDDGSDKGRPPKIGGHIPDLYYNWESLMIIGEAKTPLDLERPHSLKQYTSFLKDCEKHQGTAVFFLFTDWRHGVSAENAMVHLKSMMGLEGVRTEIVTQLTLI